MDLKQRLEQDLKTALLSGDKNKVMTLRSIKSAVLNEEVAKGLRDAGLPDADIAQIIAKESKKRQESADLYRQGHDEIRAAQELSEKAIIDSYLPKQLSEAELGTIVDEVVTSTNAFGPQAMGQVIGQVKQKVGVSADGATIARLVKDRLSE
jgi:uncharacterized protein YqeY